MFKKINWRYALGEILIVIIGITLAFSLNNWNEGRKQAVARSQYLTQLRQDLESDRDQLQDNIGRCKERMRLIEQLLPHLGRTLPGRDTAYRQVYYLPGSIEFRSKTSTYQTLINTGDYALIDQFALRAAIEAHYLSYEHIQKEYERQDLIISNYLGEFFIRNMDYGKLRAGNYDFLDDPLLRNIAQSLYGALRLKIEASEEGIAGCEQLISQLDLELSPHSSL